MNMTDTPSRCLLCFGLDENEHYECFALPKYKSGINILFANPSGCG
jgi:hypothetical protein